LEGIEEGLGTTKICGLILKTELTIPEQTTEWMREVKEQKKEYTGWIETGKRVVERLKKRPYQEKKIPLKKEQKKLERWYVNEPQTEEEYKSWRVWGTKQLKSEERRRDFITEINTTGKIKLNGLQNIDMEFLNTIIPEEMKITIKKRQVKNKETLTTLEATVHNTQHRRWNEYTAVAIMDEPVQNANINVFTETGTKLFRNTKEGEWSYDNTLKKCVCQAIGKNEKINGVIVAVNPEIRERIKQTIVDKETGRAIITIIEIANTEAIILISVYAPNHISGAITKLEAEHFWGRTLLNMMREIETPQRIAMALTGDFNCREEKWDNIGIGQWQQEMEMTDIGATFTEQKTHVLGGRIDGLWGCKQIKQCTSQFEVGDTHKDHSQIKWRMELWQEKEKIAMAFDTKIHTPKSNEYQKWTVYKEKVQKKYEEKKDIWKAIEETIIETFGQKTEGQAWGNRGDNKKWARRAFTLEKIQQRLKLMNYQDTYTVRHEDVVIFEPYQKTYVGTWKREELQPQIQEEIKKIGWAGTEEWGKQGMTWSSFYRLKWWDPKLFWKLTKGKTPTIPLLRVKGEEGVIKTVQNFYEKLYSKKEIDEKETKKGIAKNVFEQKRILTYEASWEEFEKAISKKEKQNSTKNTKRQRHKKEKK